MEKSIYDIVGEKVREERKKAGLTMEELAGLAQISTSFLAYIETKGRKASLEEGTWENCVKLALIHYPEFQTSAQTSA